MATVSQVLFSSVIELGKRVKPRDDLRTVGRKVLVQVTAFPILPPQHTALLNNRPDLRLSK